MTATVGANLGMNYAWASGEDGWNVGMDANLLKIDTLAKLKVINYTTTTPPVSPSEGDVYIVGIGATGDWSGLDKKVVVRTGTSWTSYAPVKGWLAYNENTSSYIGYNGTNWIVKPFGASGNNITTITSSSNWTIGAETVGVKVIIVGAGGGGGSGGSNGSTATGGAGGGGGSAIEATFTRAQILAAYGTGIVPVGIGAGAAGGASVTNASSIDGNDGSAGGNTTFGSLVTAYGGGGGGKGYGTSTASTGGAGGSPRAAGATASSAGVWGAAGGSSEVIPSYGCGAGGGYCSIYGVSTTGIASVYGGQSGGGGGGSLNGDTYTLGNDGGPRFNETTGGAKSPNQGDAGGNGGDPAGGGPAGGGGAGGNGSYNMTAGAGGNGGLGSGGGGGGASNLTYASGGGGTGGNGYVIVVEW